MEMVKSAAEARLSRDAWADAALNAIARDGIDAVAIEPIAALLGVTKGSFYWHFKNRSELVEAALDQWQVRATERIIDRVSASTDPVQRLRNLLALVLSDTEGNRGENAIFGGVADPVVAAAVRRVNAVRLGFLEQIFLDLGFSKATARVRARVAYSAYLGHVTLQTSDPNGQPQPKGYIDALLVILTTP
jgi:AcrR family transcriptional regulator